jgi:hypothetical protein
VRIARSAVWIPSGPVQSAPGGCSLDSGVTRCDARRPAGSRARRQLPTREIPVLDLVYVLSAIALFAVVALIGKAAEKL